MTYEEARNLIDEMRAEIRAKHMCRSMDGECTSEEVAEYRCRFAALSMAIEALEKQNRIVEQLEEEKNHCCVGCYEDYDPYEDGRFETYEEVITLLKGVQNE